MSKHGRRTDRKRAGLVPQSPRFGHATSMRGGPVILSEHGNLETAKAAGEREYERRVALAASGVR